MKGTTVAKVAAAVVAMVVATSATAGDWSAGARFDFIGGPCFSVVLAQRVGSNTVVKLSVGGFPGVLLRIQTSVAAIPDTKDRGFFGTGGVGYNRYYRGRAKGHGLVELHAGLGHFWRSGGDLTVAPEVGLVYVPTSLNTWVVEIWKNENGRGPKLPIVPYAGVDLLRKLK